MFDVVFYEKKDGNSDVWDFLEELRLKSETNKDCRIQYRQIILYIELLKRNGTRINENVTKYIGDGIWELRPGVNRIFYFCFCDDKIVLLHHFRKKSNKTPYSEIVQAKKERDDFVKRGGL